MANPFSARDNRVSGAIDRAFGELFTFEAFKPGDDVSGRKTPDASRVAFDAIAIWEGTSKSGAVHARGGSADDVAHNWTASYPSVSVNDALLAWSPRPGDKVTRQFDGQFYEIARTYPDGMGRLLLQLTAKKRWPVVDAGLPSLRFDIASNSQYVPLV
jgi:hypothetical protein